MKILEVTRSVAPLARVSALLLLAGCNTGPTLSDEGRGPEPGREVYRMSRVVDEMNQGVQRDRMLVTDMSQKIAMLEGEIRQLRGTVDELRHQGGQSDSGAGPVPPPAVGYETAPPPPPPAGQSPAVASAPGPAAAAAVAASVARSEAPMRIPVGAGEVASPPGATPAVGPSAKLSPAPVAPPGGTSSGGQTPPPAAPATQAPVTPEKSYDDAFVLLKSGQYDKALPAFDSFVKQNPQSDLADNSQYWIGEMHYVQRRFTDALVAFNKVLLDWPTSDKIPASLLKIGFSFYELEDMANAKASLERLVKEYPTSSAVTPAKQRLKLINQKLGTP